MSKKRKVLLTTALTLTTIIVVGCSSDEDLQIAGSDMGGGVSINLTPDFSLLSSSASATSRLASVASSSRAGSVDLSTLVDLPTIDDFSMSIYTVEGGSEVLYNTWSSVGDFQNGTKFKRGSYRVYVESGEEGKEGVGCAYFAGVSDFTVEGDDTVNVAITASLANAVMTVTYTEEFAEYFTDGELLLSTKAGDTISIAPLKGETTSFFNPGTLSCVWVGVRESGTARAELFTDRATEAKTLYTLNMDLDAAFGTLTIEYDDEVEEIDFDFMVGEYLVPVDDPIVTAVGFTSGEALEIAAGESPDATVRVELFADGAIADCIMEVDATTASELGIDATLSLVSTSVQTLLTLEGLTIKGLGSDMDKGAYIDFTTLIPILSEGEHTFTLYLIDSYGRESESVVLKVVIV